MARREASSTTGSEASSDELPTSLPFPPISHTHIVACAYSTWYENFKHLVAPSRIVPLDTAFVDYLRADGIVLPPSGQSTPGLEVPPIPPSPSADSAFFSHATSRASSPASSAWSNDSDSPNPAIEFPQIHRQIYQAIKELGGSVYPKLDWSAPKDSAWILPSRSMECHSANDTYLLLKSSDFVTHDLEYAFVGCAAGSPPPGIEHHLILRKALTFLPSLEHRVFVRRRQVIGISQRDMNYYDFLQQHRELIEDRILDFFEDNIRDSFSEENYTFDVYLSGLSGTADQIKLVDFNPWAPRTDPLLFSWLELLTMPVTGEHSDADDHHSSDSGSQEEIGDVDFLRLVQKDDPEAYAFNSTKYSAHKLPRDIVDAGLEGPGPIREFANEWREMTKRRDGGS